MIFLGKKKKATRIILFRYGERNYSLNDAAKESNGVFGVKKAPNHNHPNQDYLFGFQIASRGIV